MAHFCFLNSSNHSEFLQISRGYFNYNATRENCPTLWAFLFHVWTLPWIQHFQTLKSFPILRGFLYSWLKIFQAQIIKFQRFRPRFHSIFQLADDVWRLLPLTVQKNEQFSLTCRGKFHIPNDGTIWIHTQRHIVSSFEYCRHKKHQPTSQVHFPTNVSPINISKKTTK